MSDSASTTIDAKKKPKESKSNFEKKSDASTDFAEQAAVKQKEHKKPKATVRQKKEKSRKDYAVKRSARKKVVRTPEGKTISTENAELPSVNVKPGMKKTGATISLTTSDDRSIEKKSVDKKKEEEKEREKRKEEKKKEKERERDKERRRKEKVDQKTTMDDKETGDKNGRRFNMQLAQAFFKQMIESQKSRKKTDDKKIEVMPDSSHLSISHTTTPDPARKRKSRLLDKTVFRESGEPVWVYAGLDQKKELETALSEDQMKCEDSKMWLAMVEEFLQGAYDDGALPNVPPDLDPFGTMEELEEKSEVYYNQDVLQHCTCYNLYTLSEPALRRFERSMGNDAPRRQHGSSLETRKQREVEEKTAVVTQINFHINKTFSISYDRRHPILSIQKFRKKYQARLSVEKCPSKGSKEVSKETY